MFVYDEKAMPDARYDIRQKKNWIEKDTWQQKRIELCDQAASY